MTEITDAVQVIQQRANLLYSPRVWHVGTTILAQKKPDSHAGSGLAVSLHPQGWRWIARLAGPLFRLEKASGMFVDMHACLRLPQLMRAVWAWALAERYVLWQQLYRVAYHDPQEEGRWHALTFLDEGQARAEYQALQEDGREARSETPLGYAPTERMRVDMIHTAPP